MTTRSRTSGASEDPLVRVGYPVRSRTAVHGPTDEGFSRHRDYPGANDHRPMHTTDELTSETFEYRRAGEAVPRTGVMPAMAVEDRLGVVMASPTDGLGAGNFVLSCVTAFYDALRVRRDEFFEYPDYYTFQASPDPLDYLEFDIWPDHKNVPVAPDPERVLRAVNDRAIDVLLVPDSSGSDAAVEGIEDVTLRSAERRIDACYLYAPDGDLADADLSIGVPWKFVGDWYRETLDAAGDGAAAFAPPRSDDTALAQGFREIGLEGALTHLPTGEGP